MSRTARVLLFAVRVYQTFFSALMPSGCKFYPTCSHYAADAVRIHGARRGAWLALRRVLRCHPFTRGGVDLVPDAADFPREAKSGTGPDRVGIPGFRGPVDPTGVQQPDFDFSLSGVLAPGTEPPQAKACATQRAAPHPAEVSSAKEVRS